MSNWKMLNLNDSDANDLNVSKKFIRIISNFKFFFVKIRQTCGVDWTKVQSGRVIIEGVGQRRGLRESEAR